MIAFKWCVGCEQEVAVSEFHRSARALDGLRSRCKNCRSNEGRIYREEQRRVGKTRKVDPEKAAAYRKRYNQNNHESIAAYNKAYYKANREKLLSSAKERMKLYYAENTDTVKARVASYKENNKEAVADNGRRYREQNREKIADRLKQYRKENPEVARAATARWRARRDDAKGDFTKEHVIEMYDSQNGLCAYCETPLFGNFHVDHMIPLSQGGGHDWTNIAITCPPCNLKKQARTTEEFFKGDWRSTL